MNIWIDKATRFRAQLEDQLLDYRLGISTHGFVAPREFQTVSRFVQNANAYQAAWYRNIRILISKAAKLGWRDCNFIDVGCGKGRACFFAASTGNFKKVIGVDFDSALVKSATENLFNFRGERNLEFVVADATEYSLPADKTLVFMFNPFDAVVMSKLLTNNVDKLENVMIAYSNDRERDVLQSHGLKCEFRDEDRKLSLWCK